MHVGPTLQVEDIHQELKHKQLYLRVRLKSSHKLLAGSLDLNVML